MESTVFSRVGVFGDRMFSSTDLNRRGGEVLNQALKQPVTISRNAEQFALMPREQAAELFRCVEGLTRVTEIVAEAQAAIRGSSPREPLEWLAAFDRDELEAFVEELISLARQIATKSHDWGELEAALHAWRESAAVAQSGVLDDAIAEGQDPAPLPNPDHVGTPEGA